MNFWLNIYKPPSISSAKAVYIIKKTLSQKKVGHTGTLDVEAQGVLPIAIGQATKLTKFLLNAKKEYIFTIKFGAFTDTDDASGEIIETTDNIPTHEMCESVCAKFLGDISQTPSRFSAIKKDGIRSYKLARNGVSFELDPRTVHIYDLKLIDTDLITHNTATYRVKCSKGTYVRTLAKDIALLLQSCGFVIKLERVVVGVFNKYNSIDLDYVSNLNQSDACRYLIQNQHDIASVLSTENSINVEYDIAKKIHHGQLCHVNIGENLNNVSVMYDNKLLAIGSIKNGCFYSGRVFNLVDILKK
ncbi:MAG: tRNA pseudouridine(55) synthase TruB [Rickettsiaceae bacterium]